MKNVIQNGDVKDHAVTSGEVSIAAGDVVNIGQMCGVAATSGTYANSDSVAVNLKGVYELPKNNNLVITEGDELFWDTTAKEVTKTKTDKPLGIAWSSEIDVATTVEVLLVPKKGDQNTSLGQAANVAFSAGANLTAVPGSFADEAAVQTYLVTLRGDIETRLDAIDTALLAEIAALKAAGLQATS